MTNTITPGGPGDLSDNRFAASMKELANGLSGWAALLLLIFLFWRIGTSEVASFFSIRAFVLIVLAEIAFVVAALVANVVLAGALALVATPFVLKGKVRAAQNVQNAALALFGIALCIGAWFFASYAFHFSYPSS